MSVLVKAACGFHTLQGPRKAWWLTRKHYHTYKYDHATSILTKSLLYPYVNRWDTALRNSWYMLIYLNKCLCKIDLQKWCTLSDNRLKPHPPWKKYCDKVMNTIELLFMVSLGQDSKGNELPLCAQLRCHQNWFR